MAKAKKVGLWVIQFLIATLFVLQGVAKLTDGGGWVERFAEWGYPNGFVVVVGVVELIAAVGVLIPATAVIGAVLLIIIMVGAAFTHLTHGEIQVITNIIVIALCLLIIRGRQTQLKTWLQRFQ